MLKFPLSTLQNISLNNKTSIIRLLEHLWLSPFTKLKDNNNNNRHTRVVTGYYPNRYMGGRAGYS